MPIELHVHPARPLDDGVPTDGIGKGRHHDVRPRRLGECDRFVEVGDEIAGPLGAEGIGNRRLEAEQRDRPDRGLKQLRGRAARRWGHGGDDLLGALTSEGREKAFDERSTSSGAT